MSIEVLENSETSGQGESPIPELRKDLEEIIDPEAQRRVEEYVAGLPTEPTESSPDWLLGLKVREHPKKDNPIELVIDLCREICEIAAVSGPFLFPDPDKDKIKEMKRSTGNVQRQLNGALTILRRAQTISDYYRNSDGKVESIQVSDVKLVEEIFNRAWQWYEYAWEIESFDLPLPEKRTTPGRPAAEHVNALEWRLWQVLQCTGMTRRIASRYIKQWLSFYGLSERPWESIEQRLIKQEKSSRS